MLNMAQAASFTLTPAFICIVGQEIREWGGGDL